MSCTTILVGKKASYDGSTMIARNDDSGAGSFTPKKFMVIKPEDQPRKYTSVLSHVEVELPENPLRYTCMPNALEGEGTWAAAGVNADNVAMTATETIACNERVLGADPLVKYKKAENGHPEQIGGIGEEDIVVLTLPYIHNARDGVKRLGNLLEKYGTYEENGIGFSDLNEIWWLETIGGHHWIARRVPDDSYVTMPNQLGIDYFDLDDAFGEQNNYMCSRDLREFIEDNHLNLSMDGEKSHAFNPRDVFGTHTDSDHCYNTPRAWWMQRCLNPKSNEWDGPHAQYGPESDDIPWCRVPEKKITIEDVKYVLSGYYQGTPYNPYAKYGHEEFRGAYRSIGINRNDFMAILQLRPYVPSEIAAVEWICFASNAFNTMVPQYANIERTPEYLNNTTGEVSTENFYWTSRLIAALADAHYGKNLIHIERYQESTIAQGHTIIGKYDREIKISASSGVNDAEIQRICEKANDALAAMVKKEATNALGHVLHESSNAMKNQYSRSDN